MTKWTRFAPTPSGYIHLGNALNFFLTWAWARREKMAIALRIDDIDRSRFRLNYLDDIFASLDWLKLAYQAGPVSSTEFVQAYSQNLRLEKYLAYARKLLDSGFAYYCHCSRKDIEERYGSTCYQGYCRNKNLSQGVLRLNLQYCLRMNHLEEILFQELMQGIGDTALVDRDNRPLYQLVSIIDDLQLGITHVMRGEDLCISTHIQKLLARILNLVSFSSITFRFHPLVRTQDGQKFSKSEGAFALKNFYHKTRHPAEFYLWASHILGVDVKCESATQLADSLEENYFDSEFIKENRMALWKWKN